MMEDALPREDFYHVYPVNDLRDHSVNGKHCWCRPKIDGFVVIHNSMDQRELYEAGERLPA